MYARSKTPSMGTPSVYSIHASHLTLRSSNLRSTRSMKSLRVPWYQRPILKDAYFLDTQRGAMVIACYSLVRNQQPMIAYDIIILFFYWYVFLFSIVHSLVSEHFHISYICIWYILLSHGCSWIYSLWILCYELSVCVCWKRLG